MAKVSSDLWAGVLLLATTAAALCLANTGFVAHYKAWLAWPLPISLLHLDYTLHHWINDGLMAVFFLLVGLEIKKEVKGGVLADWRHAALPVIAALGGMAVPALVYLLNTAHDSALRSGWAIPAATDIAFAVGLLALVKSRVPAALKVFLVTLAIVDDIGAILIIALFYAGAIHIHALLTVVVLCILILYLAERQIKTLWIYLPLGALLWLAMHAAGVHATLSGIVLAACMPMTKGDASCPSHRLEHALKPWVTFGIMPLFALANAGVSIVGLHFSSLAHPVTQGVMLGLLVGKPIGILLFCRLAVQCRLAFLPNAVSWAQLLGAGLLAGVGFTMSLFISTLAFHDDALIDAARLGILCGSFCAGVFGVVCLACQKPHSLSPGSASPPSASAG